MRVADLGSDVWCFKHGRALPGVCTMAVQCTVPLSLTQSFNSFFNNFFMAFVPTGHIK